MKCNKCQHENSQNKRCEKCGASLLAQVQEEQTKSIARQQMKEASEAAGWITKGTIFGSILLIVGIIALIITSDYAPPKNLGNMFARGAAGQSHFLKPGIYKVFVTIEWLMIIAGVVFWGLRAKVLLRNQIKTVQKTVVEGAVAAKSAVSEMANKDDPKNKLKKLKEMHDEGLITEDEYTTKREKIVSEM